MVMVITVIIVSHMLGRNQVDGVVVAITEMLLTAVMVLLC